MSKIYYILSIVYLVVIMLSCSTARPLTYGPADNNKSYEIVYLFEHDGCKVYRFFDSGNYVYFSNCTGSMTAISNDTIQNRVNTATYWK